MYVLCIDIDGWTWMDPTCSFLEEYAFLLDVPPEFQAHKPALVSAATWAMKCQHQGIFSANVY